MRRSLCLFLAALLPISAAAQEVQPWGSRDFSAKRVAAIKPGQVGKLVQIDPNEEPYHLTPAVPLGTQVEKTDRPAFDATAPASWFWAGISPDLKEGSPRRLAHAIGQLSLSDRTLTPRWGDVAGLVEAYGQDIADTAKGTRVSPALALAVITVESSGRVDAVSSAGATGLMQLMPATAARFNVTDPKVPEQNIAGGVAYLNFLLTAFGEDPILALAAYNAGEGAVAEHNGVPPYAETRTYVPKVLGAWTITRLFCEVPPMVVTDPCEFAMPKGSG